MVAKTKLDEKDLVIVRMLMKNARTPLSDIAKELEISDVAVRKRVTELEKWVYYWAIPLESTQRPWDMRSYPLQG